MREMQGWLSMEGKGIVQGELRLLQELLPPSSSFGDWSTRNRFCPGEHCEMQLK